MESDILETRKKEVPAYLVFKRDVLLTYLGFLYRASYFYIHCVDIDFAMV